MTLDKNKRLDSKDVGGSVDGKDISPSSISTERGSIDQAAAGPISVLTGYAADNAVYDAQGPHAEYVASENTTYFVIRGEDANPYAMAIDHDTAERLGPFKIGDNNLSNSDHHGPPTLAVDGGGTIHVFWGAHNTDIQYTTSTNAYDISSWDAKTTLTTVPKGTYTSPCVYDGDLYVGYRTTKDSGSTHVDDTYPDHEYATLIQSTDGGSTWTDLGPIIDTTGHPDAESDAYLMDVDPGSNGIHLTWFVAHGSGHNGTRSNLYHVRYDPATDTVFDLAGNSYGSTITWSQHSSGVVQAYTADGLGTVKHQIDGSVVRLITADPNTGGNGVKWQAITYDGGWTSEEIGDGSIRTNNELISGGVRTADDGTVEWHVTTHDGTTTDGVRGGAWERFVKSGGSWERAVLVERESTDREFVGNIQTVRNGTDDAAVIGIEGAKLKGDSYNLRLMCYGTVPISSPLSLAGRGSLLSDLKSGLTEQLGGATLLKLLDFSGDDRLLGLRLGKNSPNSLFFDFHVDYVNAMEFRMTGDGTDRRMSFYDDGSLEMPIGGPAPTPTDLTGVTGNRDGEIRTHDGSGTPPFGAAQWDSTNSQWVSLVDGSTFT